MARSSMGAVGGLTRGLFSLQGVIAGVAALAVGGTLFDKLIGSNADLQSQQLGMAATLGANLDFVDSQGKVLDSTKSFAAAMRVSTRMTEEFEKAALKLPGSSDELAQLFSMALAPGSGAGKSVQEIQRLSGEAMTFAKIIQNDIPQASRDLQGILTGGNIGTDNKTWLLLNKNIGMTVEQFKALPEGERFDALSRAFRRFATPEVVKAYASSWEGLSSSFGDIINKGLRLVGGPIFGELSKMLGQAVDYLSDPKNEQTIRAFATELGQNLASGIRTLVQVGGQFLKWLSSVNFSSAVDTGKEFWGFLVKLWNVLSSSIVPVFEYFQGLFAGFIEYANDGTEGAVSLTDGFLGFAQGLITVIGYVAGFIALGLTVTVYSIGKAVLWLVAAWQRFAAFMGTVPERIAIGFERIKLAFFRMGLGLLENAKKNPILGFLFGLTGIDKAIGALSKAADQMDRVLGQRETRVKLQQQAADPTNQRLQYQASRLLALGDSPLEVNVTQNITSSDPEAAGAAAARGVGRAVKTAKGGRTGGDAVEQTGRE